VSLSGLSEVRGDVNIYTWGLLNASVCVPADMNPAEVEKEVNLAIPTGIESRWEVSDAEHFSGGEPHPCPCEQVPGRVHRLLTC
jgi:hypothetical protein